MKPFLVCTALTIQVIISDQSHTRILNALGAGLLQALKGNIPALTQQEKHLIRNK